MSQTAQSPKGTAAARAPLLIDGSFGEGGGQIVRSSITLSMLDVRPLHLFHIRQGRSVPGLAAQHLTAVNAAAEISGARMRGAISRSEELKFFPSGAPQPGEYEFDVGTAILGGSAGAAMLLLHALIPPLAFAAGPSRLTVKGGTHVPFSPTFENVSTVWCPMLRRLGIRFSVTLDRLGWYASGRGQTTARIEGNAAALEPIAIQHPGKLVAVHGKALTSGLPSSIGERMASKATELLKRNRISADVASVDLPAANNGAGFFLLAEYERVSAGFEVLGGNSGTPEKTAEEAVKALLSHRASGTAIEAHLADQLLIPAALARGASTFSVERITEHLRTNAWVIQKFGLARVIILGKHGRPGSVKITPLRH